MLFSIIIPSYNVKKYIGQCIQSILSQSFKNFELIIVDDGSTDGTMDIIKDYSSRDDRIKLLEKEHSNAGDARNLALKVATGEWLVFIDADDYVDNHLLEKIKILLDDLSCDLISFGANYFDEECGIKYPIEWAIKKELLPVSNPFTAKECNDSIFQIFSTNIWNKIVRRELVSKENIRFSSLNDANDELFGSMILACSKKIAYIDECLYFYRINTGSSTQDNAKRNTSLCFLDALRQIKEELNHKELYSIFERSFLDKAIVETINALLREKDWKRYKYVYENIQKFLNEELKIAKTYHIFSDHYSTWFSYIANMSAEELMFYFYSQKDVDEISMKEWRLPYDRIKGKKILLFGAGNIGQSFNKQLKRCKDVEVTGWVDSNSKKYIEIGLDVYGIDSIKNIEFDAILVAIKDGKDNKELKKKLNEIAEGKEIVFV